jgi:uncharacterized protein with HEPN domain
VSKDRSVYIRHIYDCIGWIKEYVQAGKEAFFADRKTQDAVIRHLEVIGHATIASTSFSILPFNFASAIFRS